jgi:hypothetical protein
VILIVAVLLILLITAARRIDKHAAQIWTAGKHIAGNTVSIWMLNTTNKVAGGILETAVSIDKRAAAIDDKLAMLANALGVRK